MIDPKFEHIYNIILSIFLACLLVYMLNQIRSKPKMLNYEQD